LDPGSTGSARSLPARVGEDMASEVREALAAAGGAWGEVWVPVERDRAEDEAGFALLTVPGLAVLEIERGEVGGVAAVRVRQSLDSGAVLTLVQWGAGGGELEPTLPDGQAVVTVERGDVRVTAAAALSEESLRETVERLR
jgi:hypothetical protein